MKKMNVFILIIIGLLSINVFAADKIDWFQFGATIVSNIIIYFLPVIFAGLIYLFLKLAKKFNLESNDIIVGLVNDLVEKSIQFVEDWASKQAVKPTSDEKLNKALEVIKNLTDNEIVKKYIESHINELVIRINAAVKEEFNYSIPEKVEDTEKK